MFWRLSTCLSAISVTLHLWVKETLLSYAWEGIQHQVLQTEIGFWPKFLYELSGDNSLIWCADSWDPKIVSDVDAEANLIIDYDSRNQIDTLVTGHSSLFLCHVTRTQLQTLWLENRIQLYVLS